MKGRLGSEHESSDIEHRRLPFIAIDLKSKLHMSDDSKNRQTFYVEVPKSYTITYESSCSVECDIDQQGISGLETNNNFFFVVICCVFFAAEEEAMEPFLQQCMLDQSLPIAQRWRALFSLRNLQGDEARQALIHGAF